MVSESNAKKFIIESLLPADERRDFRTSKMFRESNTTFGRGRHNMASKVGSVMAGIRQLPEDADLIEWEDHYIEKVLPIKHGETPWKKIFNLIDDFGVKENYYWEDAVNIWWSRIIDQTFDGWKAEIEVRDVLKKHFGNKYQVIEASDEVDRKYAVDLIVQDRGRTIMGIQVKPAAYFYGRQPQNVTERAVVNPEKNAAFEERYGAPVVYVITQEVAKGTIDFIKYEDAALGKTSSGKKTKVMA